MATRQLAGPRRWRRPQQLPAAIDGNWRGNRRNSQSSIYPQAWQGNPNDPRLRHYQELERRNQQWRRATRRGDRDIATTGAQLAAATDRNWTAAATGARDESRRQPAAHWNRSWRNDNRYDWQRWRYSNRSVFHVGPYYSPYRGYGYNRFSIGVFLDPFFYDQRYWIGDPWQYRLPPAEPGTEWVRYYNDVLLVDVYTRRSARHDLRLLLVGADALSTRGERKARGAQALRAFRLSGPPPLSH